MAMRSVGRLNVVCYSLLICRYSIRHNNTQHNDIKHKGLFVIPTILAFKINEIQHKHHYPKCHYAECCILFMAMWSVGRLNVIMLNVVVSPSCELFVSERQNHDFLQFL